MHILKKLVEERIQGNKKGVFSVCSANEYVIRAALQNAKKNNVHVFIEATANQVDQNGGYTAMTPQDFYDWVKELATEENLDINKVVFGGDHLGPLTFRNEPPETAMEKAKELVRCYVKAGFTKIHIDTSMPLLGESVDNGFSSEIIAHRSAILVKTCEEAFAESTNGTHPVYVVGSEVPVPGGAMDNEMEVTSPDSFKKEMELFKAEYKKLGVDFGNVVGFVVQPGVEFTNEIIHCYKSEKARELCTMREKLFPQLVFEGHSTDFQPKKCLREMVLDGIAILKVGPALTFGMREGLYALENIAAELGADYPSFKETLKAEMDENPVYWEKYYEGTADEILCSRSYGLSDRCRYYMASTEIKDKAEALITWLDDKKIPLGIIHQYMPIQAEQIIEGTINNDARSMLYSKIEEYYNCYLYACGMNK